MKNKAPLILMEQVVMVLVFALTAAWCLRMFVLSEKLSVTYSATDRAVVEAQNVAEYIKQEKLSDYLDRHNAVAEETGWLIRFDEDWNVTEEETEYFLRIVLTKSDSELLWEAEILVLKKEEELFRIAIAGQKETEVEEDA